MKLRNLLFGTMIACAFASCSKDDVINPDNGNPDTKAGTYLALRAQDPISGTKADPTNPDAIKTLTMVVFGANDLVEAVVSSDEDEAGALSRETPITAGTKKVLMVANYDLASIGVGASYADIAVLTNTRDKETNETGFSMNSRLYTTTVELNKTTFLGYDEFPSGYSAANAILDNSAKGGVKLYRNVAQVVLQNVAVTNEKGTEFGDKYSNPNVIIKDVFIMNANNVTKVVPAAVDAEKEWASTQQTATAWFAGVEANSAWTLADKFKLASTWTNQSYLIDGIEGDVEIGYHGVGMANSTTDFAETNFYVYENGSASIATEAEKTLLVIKADVTYDTKTGRETAPDRYYTLAIGRTGLNGGFTTPGVNFPYASRSTSGINGADENKAYDVLRNLQYGVSLTIKGMGYNQPGGGDPLQMLDVKVQVVPFGYVRQNVEI